MLASGIDLFVLFVENVSLGPKTLLHSARKNGKIRLVLRSGSAAGYLDEGNMLTDIF